MPGRSSGSDSTCPRPEAVPKRRIAGAVDCCRPRSSQGPSIAHVHAPPPLGEHDVHVWTSRLDVPPSQLESLGRTLSRDEHERAARFHFDRHRAAFIAARATLRSILGDYLGAAPQDVSFEYGPNGRPSLASGDLEFNTSHSGALAVVGITRRHRIGIDVEHCRDLEYVTLAEHFFAAQEITELQSLADEERPQGFFNCWTRKEAYVKALGEGLSFPLDEFAVSLRPGAAPALLWSSRGPEEASRWQIVDISGEPDYIGAVVVERPVGQVVALRR
jgi:4'-phosphopantetheinyl transferase